MSRERTKASKLAQSRRRNDVEDEDGETGPALIDDSASELGSEDELHLSVSENEEEDEDDDCANEKGDVEARETLKSSASPPTSEGYDRIEDDTLNGRDFVDLAASSGSVGTAAKMTDTSIMMNGFKNIPAEEEPTAADGAINFDELDDSISLELSSETTRNPPSRGGHQSRSRGPARGRPDRETYWQKRNKEKEEYKRRLEDPTFTPFVGEFYMHDARKNTQFESLNQPQGIRGRGRGGRGMRGGPTREAGPRRVHQDEPVWRHDGFEELQPARVKSPSVRVRSSSGSAYMKTSSIGRQTPVSNNSVSATETASQTQQQPPPTQDQPTSRSVRPNRPNISTLASKVFSINISVPHTNADPIIKEVTLNSYVGRVPYQKALRGDLPVRISSIEGAGSREVYPSKERSWLPYFVKNAPQLKEGVHSRGLSRSSAGTPGSFTAERPISKADPTKAPLSSIHAPSFVPQSPAPPIDEDEERPAKIKVNLPPVSSATSASPAVSDSSSLHVHHPRPTKHINIAEIDDSSARLKALLNTRTIPSPSHSHERTSSTALPETAVHAAPFQPSTFLPQSQQQQPQHQHQQSFSNTYPAPMPVFYPQFAGIPGEYPSAQNPYAQPRFESNGMVYYYDPSYYYYQPSPAQGNTATQGTSQPQSQQTSLPEQSDAQHPQQQMYFYQMGDLQRGQMGAYYPYQQGT
jgi:hypothetical protein